MGEPARKVEGEEMLTAEEMAELRAHKGGPPPGPVAINPRFVRLLCRLYRDWEKDQDPATWTSKENA